MKGEGWELGRPMVIAVVAEGNAETKDCWSGSAMSFVSALRARGSTVVTLNVELKGISRAWVATSTFRVRRKRWRIRYALHPLAFAARSREATRLLQALTPQPDAIVQIGGTFRPFVRGARVPYVVYADSNIRLAERARPYSSATWLSQREIERVAERERTVYHAADRIWCMSKFLSRSFEADFGVSPAHLRVIYAGPNSLPVGAAVPALEPEAGGRKILFVGKDHVRKGLATLVEAFCQVRMHMPDAELHVVGTDRTSDAEQVTFHGFLRSDREVDRDRLMHLYQSAAVFCLPSHYEPFGIAVVEAMHCGLACVGADDWAMPEIIEVGRTGWLAPPRDASALAGVLLEALGNPAQTQSMGQAGMRRAKELFTWDLAAERALTDLHDVIENRATVESQTGDRHSRRTL